MNLGKMKKTSGIIAISSFVGFNIIGVLLLMIETLIVTTVENSGTISFVLMVFCVLMIGISLIFIVSAVIWAVLVFTDTESMDEGTHDENACKKILIISITTSFISGLMFYSPYFILTTLFLPFVISPYINNKIDTEMPHKRKMTYNSLGILAGTIFGYIVATIFVWNSLATMYGNDLSNLDLFFKSLSVYRIFYFIWLYLFFSWLGIYTEIYKKKFISYEKDPEHQTDIYHNLMKIVYIVIILAISHVIIKFTLGELCWIAGGIISIPLILLIFFYIIKLIDQFDKRV